MSYRSWFKSHGEKHRQIVDKLLARGFSKDQIIDYFDIENMVSAEPDFCVLYTQKKKCHDISKLNCYLCACPLFRFNSDGITEVEGIKTFSYCHVHSKHGSQGIFGESIHQDCSKCPVPHGRKYVSENFDIDWFYIMRDCDIGE